MTTAWWPEDEATFWLTVEAEMASLSPGTPEGTRRLVRSTAGQFVLTGLRRSRGERRAQDPVALARAAHHL